MKAKPKIHFKHTPYFIISVLLVKILIGRFQNLGMAAINFEFLVISIAVMVYSYLLVLLIKNDII